MNVGTFNNNPPENTVPSWILPRVCGQQRCHYNARFKPDLLCVKGLPYQSSPPIEPNDNQQYNSLNLHTVTIEYLMKL